MLKTQLIRWIPFLALGLVLACGGSSSGKKPGGGARGEMAAKTGDQSTGSNAKGDKAQATNEGPTANDATCDAELEGVAWCDSDSKIIFCAEGAWYALDCADFEAEAQCAFDEESLVVDCFVVSEEEDGADQGDGV